VCRGHRSRPNSHLGTLFDNQENQIEAKSFVLKDFMCKSFRIKDRVENFPLTY